MTTVENLADGRGPVGSDRIYIAPEGIGPFSSGQMSLAGSGLGFSKVRLLWRSQLQTKECLLDIVELDRWARQNGRTKSVESILSLLSTPRPSFEGLSLDQPRLVGVLNTTPDSFSDGGAYSRYETAVNHGAHLFKVGADVVDVGGESTRPGARPVSSSVECSRVLPVVDRLAQKYLISIDTSKASVMRKTIAAGARIVNDVSALTNDPESLPLIASAGCSVFLMHSRGNPRNMQQTARYQDALLDIFDYLSKRVRVCEDAGIGRERLAIDPGIGFGQNDMHIQRIMKNIGLFHGIGCPILLGTSRKSFIARWSVGEPASSRLSGSVASVLWGLTQGVQMFRVHDVAETRQAFSVWKRLSR